ncbi:MAG: YhfC family intramembrane metalloprotease [Sphaerochaetaceae bacterium]|jgi:uncharacterized membrane protein YhfC
MNYSVPVSSIIMMYVVVVFSFALPVVAVVFIRKKWKADFLPLWVGAVVFVLFAMVLERLVHSIVLGSSAGATITGNVWLYGLYGGLMAGLFEETGRFVAFRTVLKKKLGKDQDALMYGAGHGGIEVILILGVTMVNNLVYAAMLNGGTAADVLATLDAQKQATLQAAFMQLSTTGAGVYVFGMIERVAAFALHMVLSVLVWFAAKNSKDRYLFAVAIVIHFIVDMAAVVLNASGVSVALIELVVIVMVALSVWYALRVWKCRKISK